jgi:hypothetical protein
MDDGEVRRHFNAAIDFLTMNSDLAKTVVWALMNADDLRTLPLPVVVAVNSVARPSGVRC